MHARLKLTGAVAAAGALTIAVTTAIAGDGNKIREHLIGYEEVPAISTAAGGDFRATLRASQGEIAYRLSYTALSGDVTQAHIHFGQVAVNGGISAFLCSNLATARPARRPARRARRRSRARSGPRTSSARRTRASPRVSSTS